MSELALFARVAAVFCNYCRVTALLGYQPQELLGKSVYEFYHPEERDLMKDTFNQGLCSSSLINREGLYSSSLINSDINWSSLH